MAAARLRVWCREFSPSIVEITGLLKDLVRVVGEFVVPKEHLWMPLPEDLHYPRQHITPIISRVCQCVDDHEKLPNAMFMSCTGWKYQYQHTSSIYTIGELDSQSWRIHLSSDSTAQIQWWMGVVWGNDNDFENIHPTNIEYQHDTICANPKIQSITLTYMGNIYRWDGRQNVPLDEKTIRCFESRYMDMHVIAPNILQIVTDTGDSVSIPIDHPHPFQLANYHPLQFARPFIQFFRDNKSSKKATIQTL